ncbi:hypothetical protein AKO1_000405, partial [Acrasis kona]
MKKRHKWITGMKLILCQRQTMAKGGERTAGGREQLTKGRIAIKNIRDQFHIVLNDIGHIKEEVVRKTNLKCTSFENMLLLTLIWIVHYPPYSLLTALFGVSEFCISKIIHTMIPHLVEYFVQYITHCATGDIHSIMSTKIKYILDGTIHPLSKPQTRQHLWYNGHYKIHGIMSQILIDFNGYIIAVETGIPGHLHDATQARNCQTIKKIVGKDFALTDCAYSNLNFCVGGFKGKQLTSKSRKTFDKVSRHEQVLIENVNSFLKKPRTTSKDCKFK